jgi:putative selenium metabolism hydrolase
VEMILQHAASLQDPMVAFLRELIAIKSLSGQEEAVVRRVQAEMQTLGFDEVRIDTLGNILGRIGNGSRVLAFDAHLDTVDVTDSDQWSCDPFVGKTSDGCVFGRGAVDQKAGVAAMVYAGKLIKDLGLARNSQVWMVGSVMEEDCDGLCWHHILKEKVLSPELVVCTEPTGLSISRGQRGRMEIRVQVTGRSSHGSMPERGDNAIYKILPAVEAVRDLNERLLADSFLGKGTCSVTWIRSAGPSLCAVPDRAEMHIDRRLTQGETRDSALREVNQALQDAGVVAEVRTLVYEEPSWTRRVYPMEKYYPTWVMPENHGVIRAAQTTFRDLFASEPRIGRWTFSTNGVVINGLHGVPCLGFGPGREDLAHSPDEHVPVAEVVKACAFYAAFADRYGETAG